MPEVLDQEQVFQAYERKRLPHHVALILGGIGLVTPALASLFDVPKGITFSVGMGIVGAVGYLDEQKWRCPVCQHFLGLNWDSRHCPNCTTQLIPDMTPAERELVAQSADLDQVLLAFAGVKFRRRIRLWLFGIFFFILVTAAPTLNERLAILLLIMAVAANGLWAWLDWRCPACRRSLGQDATYEHCPQCGVKLEA